ncbi:FAD-binding dehydrogenase [Chitinophaga agrisoli]|uniref:FAD-binding dehydrogenase n=1 Tax=Chitinophaga agrisoli TaxID=2607653 RepID=A0A5B2VNT9_9BACT|nr:FAD-binding dehydrogenase [Chitinophaga agrisoli]KAA2240715.1 FAD-binding dehydrogenase [Chitinophaga agrisoli]
MKLDADVLIIGAGLAGLVATHELTSKGIKVILLDQEGDQHLGGQAFWSFGGLFMVDTPLQRRMGIKDSLDLALQDWMGTAGFDRAEDYWPRKWAEAYVHFAATEKYSWLRQHGLRFFPIVGWAERGGYNATGHGNSVPRFHVTWGTGPGVVGPFVQYAKEASKKGLLQCKFRHRVNELVVENNVVKGVRGTVLTPTQAARGEKSEDTVIGDFYFEAQTVIITSGGIGANHDLVRQNWPARLGRAPEHMLSGVPQHVDGRMLMIAQQAGAHLINPDRMWHYTEGIKNWAPIWQDHGIRILPGPSSMWFDAKGQRLPVPLYPGFDTLGTLQHIMHTGYDYSWFILNQKIIKKEFALSGSEQNPDLTNKEWKQVVKRVFGKRATEPVEAFKENGEDFIVADNLRALVDGMNQLTPTPLLRFEDIEKEILARDRELENKFCKDAQIAAIRNARQYLGDKLIRTAPLHPLLDPTAGPLIAVRLHILTRKTLGGLETNLDGQVLHVQGQPISGLYAAGEAAGFGGGGMHGYRALEGSFLGGCLFSGRVAGRHIAHSLK